MSYPLSAGRPAADPSRNATGPKGPPVEIVLVGNPNVGKSVLFSKLTGKFVIISNYPGTTVEITRGQAEVGGASVAVLDTPGVNELSPRTEDARVTCDVLREHPDATVVQVTDAKNLRRALLLTLEIAEMGRPMVLVLNMMDELDRRGGKIDVRKLSEILGVPVVPTIATSGTGIHLLKNALSQARTPSIRIESAEGRADLLPFDAADVAETAGAPDEQRAYERTSRRLEQVNRILARTYTLVRPHRANLAQRIGWWATHPVRGVLLVGLVLYFAFWFVGLVGAGTAVDFLESFVFGRQVRPLAIRAADAVLPFPHRHGTERSDYTVEIPLTPTRGIRIGESSAETVSTRYEVGPGGELSAGRKVVRFVHDFLVGEYGLITMALSYGLAIVLPIVTTFFLLFGVLEDSGYLPRLAVMVNRIFRGMGLNGKAVLPMILGLGCDTMATMTTRILETRKERVVTTLLLALAVPCSAQLGVLLAMMASLSYGAAAFWLLLMLGIAFLIGWLAARLYGGQTSDFILELPPMRWPQPGNVAVKTLARLDWYLREVIPLFVLGTGILFLLDQLDLLGGIARLGEPLVQRWLGLPAATSNAFLIGFLRRDFGAVYLLNAATGPGATLSPHQVLVAMVTITLFMPCIATLFMIARELGKKTAAFMTFLVFFLAFLIGGLVNHVAHLFGF